jgi:uncharacterized protein (DUF2236 family)
MADFDEKGRIDPNALLEVLENTQHSIIPSPTFEILSPNHELRHLQRVLKEGILLTTGGLAILLQMANPKVAQGVNENSNFASRPTDRFRRTMTYVYCMAFGTSAEKKAVIEMVHRVHQSVVGPGYTADDPELQLWVAATLYFAGANVYQKIFGDFDDVTADELYKEYSVMATSLRVPPEMWPKSRQAFWEYWDGQIETLEVTSHAKAVAKDLLYNKASPLWIRVNLPLIRLSTAEWLPARMREAYGLKTSKSRRRFHRLWMGVIRKAWPRLPIFVREYPLRYYMKDMRRRMKDEGAV